MTTPNNHSPTDTQTEKIIDSLKDEIASLKSQPNKKDDRIASLDVMLNQTMQTHTAQSRAYEDLEDKLKDVIDMLRKRTPHGDILDFLKVKDSNEFQFQKLW
jgi:chromosome segregation ATPase